MKKKILSVICAALILMFTLQIPAREIFADFDTVDVYDEGGFLSYAEVEEIDSMYDSLLAETGTQFVFLTTDKELPDDDNIPTDYPYLTAYLQGSTPCIIMMLSDLTNTATIRSHNCDLTDELLDDVLDVMIENLNENSVKEAACEAALRASELMKAEFDPAAYRDWILGSEAQPEGNTANNTDSSYSGHHVCDLVGLLSAEDQIRYEQLFAEKSAEIGVDIIFYSTPYFSDDGNAAASYLGGVCSQNGYGYGDERYVIMFAVSKNNRYAMCYEWSANIKTYHRYLQVELDDIFDAVKPYLSKGADNWNTNVKESNKQFASAADTFLEYAIRHADFDDAPYEAFDYSDNYERYDLDGHRKALWGRFGLFGVISAAISGIATALCAAKHKPKTVTDPEVYSNRSEFNILESSDNFRVRTTTRVRISSDSGGGGGHSHGGGGGGGGHGSGGHF